MPRKKKERSQRSRTVSRDVESSSQTLRQLTRQYYGGTKISTPTLAFEQGPKVSFATKLAMRRDPIIALGLWSLKAPLSVCDFTVECEDRVVAAFVTAQLKNLWSRLMRSSLKMLDFGWQPHELVYKIQDVKVEVTPKVTSEVDSKPEPIIYEMKNMIVLHKVKDIKPTTLYPVYDGESDEFIGVKVRGASIINSEADQLVPAKKLYIPSWDPEWGDVEGKSLLENIYQPWYYGQTVEQLWARFMERRVIPPLVGTGPTGLRMDDEGNQVDLQEQMITIINNIHHGNGAYLPFEPGNDGKNMWGIESLNFFAQTDQFTTFLATQDAKMLRGILIPEKVLIQGAKVGTLSETTQFTDTFLTGLDVILFDLEKVMQEQIVDNIVSLNFSNAPPVKLTLSQITAQRRSSLKELVALLMDATDVNSRGVVYKFRDQINFETIARQLGIPLKDSDDIIHAGGLEDEPDPEGTEPDPKKD